MLALGKNYLNQKQNNIFFKTLNNIQNTEIDTSSFYKDILEDLENEYYKLDEELIEKLIDFYLVQVEQKKSSSDRNNETLHQFLCLNGNSNKNSDFMGRFSSNEKILEALHNYDEMINSPTMKKKRAYKFHSEDRGEWTETIYKKFLEGLLKYFDCSINNKKIAKFIGSSISANQVKFVKGKYLRRLKKRSKDVRIIVKDLLKEDICNFNMKIFEFISQITRKI